MSILNENVKNTRFILTLLGVSSLILCLITIIALSIFGIDISTNLATTFATVVGAILALATTSYNSYFKDRQTTELAKVEKK